MYTAAISLGGCVQGVGTRVARVGGRCAVVWLASEWHCVVCAVCVLKVCSVKLVCHSMVQPCTSGVWTRNVRAMADPLRTTDH